MRLINKTSYPGKVLRSIITEVHNRLSATEGRLHTWNTVRFEVVYTKRHDTSGWATYGGWAARLRLKRRGVDVAVVARLVDHEMLHLYGFKHSAMECARPNTYHSDEYLERFAWARERWGARLEPRAPRPKSIVPLRELRAARVQKRLALWEAKLLRAQRAVKRLRVKARYYREAARRGAVTMRRNALREAVVSGRLALALGSGFSGSEAARAAFRAVPGLRGDK